MRRVIRRIDPWTVLKFSALFYVSMVLVLLVAGTVLWLVATVTGLRHNIERFMGDLVADPNFHFLGGDVLIVAAISGFLLVVVGSGINVLMTVLYNLISEVIGGVEVTVLEEDPGSHPVV